MKKFFAILLTLILAFACVAALAEEGYEINYVTPEELPAYEDMEFDPNEEYDMWTIAEYTIEDIQADLVCTVSAKDARLAGRTHGSLERGSISRCTRSLIGRSF